MRTSYMKSAWSKFRKPHTMLLISSQNPAAYSTYSNSAVSFHYSVKEHFRFTPYVIFATILGVGCLSNVSSSEPESHPKYLSLTEVRDELRSRLKVIRAVLSEKKLSCPEVFLSHENNLQSVSINLDQSENDIFILLDDWLKVLEENKSTSQSRVAVISSGLSRLLEISSCDKSKLIRVKYEGLNINIQIVSENGFTSDELKLITEGYRALYSSPFQKQFPINKRREKITDFMAKTYILDSELDNVLDMLLTFSIPLQVGSFSDDFWDQDSEEDSKSIFQHPAARFFQKPSFNEEKVHLKKTPLNRIENGKLEAITKLEKLGVEAFDQQTNIEMTWDCLAGYEKVKQNIEETVVNSLKYPEIYDAITHKTRAQFESNRPKAILLEGPPGTGKTLTARILASQCNRPLIHLKLENFVSKWYGESEKKLSQILDACDELEGTIIFIDEIDAMAGSRDSSMNEATRRILSVMLQRIEGFQGKGKSLLICATNRREDLDPAMLSRFDLSIRFELPDLESRKRVFERYARQFSIDGDRGEREVVSPPLQVLAAASDGLSCRDIKESCEHAERVLASRIIRKEEQPGGVPSVEDYLACLQHRRTPANIPSNPHPNFDTSARV